MVRKRGWSVLASTEFIDVPGMVVRPLVDPVPLSPVSMVWRKGLRHPGLDALRRVAAGVTAAERGLELPPGGWIPGAIWRSCRRCEGAIGRVVMGAWESNAMEHLSKGSDVLADN